MPLCAQQALYVLHIVDVPGCLTGTFQTPAQNYLVVQSVPAENTGTIPGIGTIRPALYRDL